jgi:hypothetical protein
MIVISRIKRINEKKETDVESFRINNEDFISISNDISKKIDSKKKFEKLLVDLKNINPFLCEIEKIENKKIKYYRNSKDLKILGCKYDILGEIFTKNIFYDLKTYLKFSISKDRIIMQCDSPKILYKDKVWGVSMKPFLSNNINTHKKLDDSLFFCIPLYNSFIDRAMCIDNILAQIKTTCKLENGELLMPYFLIIPTIDKKVVTPRAIRPSDSSTLCKKTDESVREEYPMSVKDDMERIYNDILKYFIRKKIPTTSVIKIESNNDSFIRDIDEILPYITLNKDNKIYFSIKTRDMNKYLKLSRETRKSFSSFFINF